MKYLKLRTSYTTDTTFQCGGYYRGTYTKARASTQPSDAQSNAYNQLNYNFQNFLTYTKTVGAHNFNLLAGTTVDYFQNDASATTVVGLPYRSLWYNLGTATAVTINGVTIEPSTVTSSNYSKQTTWRGAGGWKSTCRRRPLLSGPAGPASLRACAAPVI